MTALDVVGSLEIIYRLPCGSVKVWLVPLVELKVR